MTDKPPPEEGTPQRKGRGIHQLAGVDGMNLADELADLLDDLDSLELGEQPPPRKHVVQLDLETEEEAAAAPAKARGLPKSAEEALADDDDDDDFLKELGFGEDGGEIEVEVETDLEDPAPYQARIEELETEIEALTGKLRRVSADFDNFRKRMKREKEETVAHGNEKILKDLLPILDSFSLALAHSDGTDLIQLVTGVEMVYSMMLKTLGRFGLESFESQGSPFDPRFHQAMQQVPRADMDPGTVVAEAQSGFRLYGRLLRPALVTVSMQVKPQPSAEPKEPEVPTTDEGEEMPADVLDEAESAEDAAAVTDDAVETSDATEDAGGDAGSVELGSDDLEELEPASAEPGSDEQAASEAVEEELIEVSP